MEPIIIKGLEIWPKDFGGQMTWDEAMAEVKELGPGWRLPTREEFRETLASMYYHIPNLHGDYYWSSTENDYFNAWYFYFPSGSSSFNDKDDTCYVRAVRDFISDIAIEYLLKDF